MAAKQLLVVRARSHKIRHAVCPHSQGFTLIEVLVAISVMALMSLMAWRGLDSMLRVQSSLEARSDEIRNLQAGLTQWQMDLDQLTELRGTSGWGWDGRVLRLTRHNASDPASVQVVAWTWRNDPGRPGGGDWQRWQSGPLQRLGDWQSAWALAQQWGQTPDANTRAGQVQIFPLAGWQLFVHRGGSWANPLSSATVNADSSPNTIPDGMRLVLALPSGPVGQGDLTLDWVRPTLSGPPS